MHISQNFIVQTKIKKKKYICRIIFLDAYHFIIYRRLNVKNKTKEKQEKNVKWRVNTRYIKACINKT